MITTEIDIVEVTRKGIFVYECKNVAHRHTTKDVYTDKEVKEIYKKLLKYKGTAKQIKEHEKRQARIHAEFR